MDSIDRRIIYLVLFLFAWFFASSLTTAVRKAPQQDDAMFTTVAKNLVNGYGWATSYGEEIPINPDLTAGPSLILPAAGMISLFGIHSWTPAVTGWLLNLVLAVLILQQLYKQTRQPSAHFVALLLSLTIFAVHDFRTFTGYYASAQLFVLALLLGLNAEIKPSRRLLVFGALAAIAYLAKPLALLSFLLATPWIIFYSSTNRQADTAQFKNFLRNACLIIAAFLVFLTPWKLYQSHKLNQYSESYQLEHTKYKTFFFENHGTGIAQFNQAKNKFKYIKNNTRKNYRLLRKFFANNYNAPAFSVFIFIFIVFFWAVRQFTQNNSPPLEVKFLATLSFVTLTHYAWYVIVSFAMTPGHAYFPAWYSFFILFFFIAYIIKDSRIAIMVCLLATLLFPSRHVPLMNAYQFKANDHLLTNQHIEEALNFIQPHSFSTPLASCGYHAAPWRLELLMPKSGNFLDCFNMIEDALQPVEQSPNQFQWSGSPSFTLVMEGFNLIISSKDKAYVLEPIFKSCEKNMLFKNDFYIICEVVFEDIKQSIKPSKTAQELIDYRGWYKTRL